MTRRVLRVRVVRARVVRARVAVRHLALVSLCAGVALISACIHTFWRTDARAVRPASANDAPYELRTPVKVHLLAIYRVLQARNRTEAVVAAQKQVGLISTD